MLRSERRARGLFICGIIAAWLIWSSLSASIEDAEYSADIATQGASLAQERADEVGGRVDDLCYYRDC